MRLAALASVVIASAASGGPPAVVRDGAKLFTRVYVPKDAKGPLPILFLRTPYGIDGRAERQFKVYLRDLVEDGYVFAYQDVRGRHQSEGTFVMTRPPRDPTDPKPVRAVVTFAPGGALASNDFDPPSPPGLGAWESDGDHRFQSVFWLGDRDPSDPTATVQVRVRANGHWQDDEIGGTFHADVFSGGHLIASPKGTFQGHRLEP